MENSNQLVIKSCLDAWNTHTSRTDKLINELSDEQLQNEVAPGRNTGVYLLGHLTAVHDNLFPLLGIGEKLYGELYDTFVKSPDKSGLAIPSLHDLRNYWHEVNEKLSEQLNAFTFDEWLQKHAALLQRQRQRTRVATTGFFSIGN